MDPLIWAIVLLALAIALIFLEMFVPSGGVLGFLAFAAALSSVILAYYFGGPIKGTMFLAAAVLVLPAVVALALKWWPHTPLGRRIIIEPPSAEDVLPDTERTRRLKTLLGKRGRARSTMLPGGVVAIDGRSYDAVSEGQPIETGQPIEVVEVEGNRVVVRAIDTGEAAAPPEEDADLLSRPIETFGLDPFDDPPA